MVGTKSQYFSLFSKYLQFRKKNENPLSGIKDKDNIAKFSRSIFCHLNIFPCTIAEKKIHI